MDRIVGLAVIGFVAYTVATHALAVTPTLTNLSTVTQLPSSFKLLGTPNDATGTFEIHDRKTGALVGAFYTDDRGVLYDTPEQADHGSITGAFKPVTTALRLGTDLGAVAGYSATQGSVGAVRYSPFRIFDNIAPDIIAGPQALGLGVSLYLPRTYGPQWLSHVGVGAWYTSDLHGGMSPVIGLSVSTH